MSITDELRKRIDDEALLLSTRRELWNIADRIDAEHEKAVADAFQDGASCEVNVDAWVRLPVDADGVPIHVGDRLDGYGKTIDVVEIRNGRSGWVVISRDGNGYADTFAFTHHRPPTVEDILREFAERVGDGLHTIGAMDTQVIIAEYAAKLRLAGEDE